MTAQIIDGKNCSRLAENRHRRGGADDISSAHSRVGVVLVGMILPASVCRLQNQTDR